MFRGDGAQEAASSIPSTVLSGTDSDKKFRQLLSEGGYDRCRKSKFLSHHIIIRLLKMADTTKKRTLAGTRRSDNTYDLSFVNV